MAGITSKRHNKGVQVRSALSLLSRAQGPTQPGSELLVWGYIYHVVEQSHGQQSLPAPGKGVSIPVLFRVGLEESGSTPRKVQVLA